MKSRPHDPQLCDHLVMEVIGREWNATRLAADDPGLSTDLGSRAIPEALECEPDTGPLGFTMVGPLLDARRPGRPTCGRCGSPLVTQATRPADLAALPVFCDGRCEIDVEF